jgi:hypothetical protein
MDFMTTNYMCNGCGCDLVGNSYTWRCDVCNGRLCADCEDLHEASNHAIVASGDHNPDCPFCTDCIPMLLVPGDTELADMLSFALEALGTDYETFKAKYAAHIPDDEAK